MREHHSSLVPLVALLLLPNVLHGAEVGTSHEISDIDQAHLDNGQLPDRVDDRVRPWMAPDHENDRGSLFRHFLRLLGITEDRIGQVALDVLIYLGDTMARRIIGDDSVKNEIPQYRSLMEKEGFLSGMTALLSKSESRSRLVKKAVLDRSLPQTIIDGLDNRTDPHHTGCIQLFLCTVSPVIWRLQEAASSSRVDFSRSLSNNWRDFNNRLWRSLPDLKAVASFSSECNRRLPQKACPLLHLT